MKSGNNSEKHIRSARALHRRLSKQGIQTGCLPISIRALGGEISFHKVISQPEQTEMLSCLSETGLEVGGFIPIDEKVTGKKVELLLDHLASIYFEELADSSRFAGFLVLSYFDDDNALKDNNHYFAILPRDALRPRVRKKLIKKREYLVVDSGGGNLVGRTHVNDLAKFINHTMKFGGKFLIFQVFKT